MFLDALTMACLADELRKTILEGRVQKVLLPDRFSVGFEIYAGQQRHYLLASAHPEQGRLLLSSERLRRGMDKETGLLQILRKYVRGARIANLGQPPFERILRIEFQHPEWGSTGLYVEIMGRHSNLILVDAKEQVLDSVKRVGPHLSPTRPILPAQPYTPPPPQEKLSPLDLTEYRLKQILAEAGDAAQVWQALVRGIRGMSPLLAREISFRAIGHARAPVSQVERLTPLLENVSILLDPLETGSWQPTIVLEENLPTVYAPYPITHRGEPQPMSTMSAAIEAYTLSLANADPYLAAKRPVQEAISNARARLEGRRNALNQGLTAAAEAKKWRMWGDWILTYGHTITPGQEELVAETGEGEVLIVPLDPLKSATDNAQACYARYRKAQRATEGGPERLAEVNLQLDDLDQLETDLQLADSRPAIEAVRAALEEAGYVRVKKQKGSRFAPSKPLSVTSPDGYLILVGRNSRQNDEVTFRRASGNDWWFHARGVPGAHVIVRTGDDDLPPATIQAAAELAGYYSRLRDEAEVSVDYTRRRHVRRIPKAAAGIVTYSQESVVRVPPRLPDVAHSE